MTGVVQGVGFRPFVYRLARLHHLAGWVCNTSQCVEIEIEGPPASLARFINQLEQEAPALARIEAVVSRAAPPEGSAGFTIRESRHLAATEALIPADVATCDDCLADIADPGNRRYQYPFTNCTNCGPRFTIIREVPYDRLHTTMAVFGLCPRCRAEYENPEDRRFHAEPTACPVCGPRVWLEEGDRRLDRDAIPAAASLLHQGRIVAIKGLGGFHLAADAGNDQAVATLRERKGRVAKPFALMVRDLAEAERLCHLGDLERSLLLSRERPIVVARRRPNAGVSPHVAPGHKFLGLMLPYTPLHFLLMEHAPAALVMTSGNLSEEPLVHANIDARRKLAGLADAFLLHDRDIQVPCDDSVVRPVDAAAVIPLRRARGLVPAPIYLPLKSEPVLGVGAEQKNTFCVAAHGVALLSQHIGDLDSVETFDYYQQAITHFKALCRQDPAIVAHDLHPLYLSTRYARGLAGVRLIGVQHHHAHIAACLAENRRTDQLYRHRPGRHRLRPRRHRLGRGTPGGGPGRLHPGRPLRRRAPPGRRSRGQGPGAHGCRLSSCPLRGRLPQPGPAAGLGLIPPWKNASCAASWPRASIRPSPPAPDASSTRWPRPWTSAAPGPTKGSRPWNWKWPPTKPKTASIPRPSKMAPDALVLDTLAIFRAVVRDRLAGVACRRHRRPLPQLPGPAPGRRLRPDPGADRAFPGGPVRRRDAERPAVHPAATRPGGARLRGAHPHPDAAQRRLHLPGPGGRGRGPDKKRGGKGEKGKRRKGSK